MRFIETHLTKVEKKIRNAMEKKVKKTQKMVVTISRSNLNIHDKLRPGHVRLATLKKGGNKINVAVKLSTAGHCPREDLPMEARLMARLRHPNVVALHGVADGKRQLLVMEHLPSGDLYTVLMKKGKLLPWESRLTVAGQVAEAMAYLHSRGVVHFALNASNVFLDLTDPGMPVCKVGNFEKAEQFQKDNENRGVAEKEDVHSFGILMWELLVGQPFPHQNYHDVHDITERDDTSDDEGDHNGETDGIGESFFHENHVNEFHALASQRDESGESTDDELFHGKASEKKLLEEEEEEEEVEPPLVPEWCYSEWGRLMEDCWSANPAKRPSFKAVVKRLGRMEYMIVEEHPRKIKGNRFWLAVVLISMLIASVMFLGMIVTSKKVDGK